MNNNVRNDTNNMNINNNQNNYVKNNGIFINSNNRNDNNLIINNFSNDDNNRKYLNMNEYYRIDNENDRNNKEKGCIEQKNNFETNIIES